MSIRIELERSLENEFREKAMRVYGYSKGSISQAGRVALRQWTKSVEMMKPEKKIKNPSSLIRGSLSHLKGKKTSVELQHEAVKEWIRRVD